MHQEKSSLHPPSNSDCGQEAEAGYTGPASSQHKPLQASPRDRGVTVPDNLLCSRQGSALPLTLQDRNPPGKPWGTARCFSRLCTARQQTRMAKESICLETWSCCQATPRQLFPWQAGVSLCSCCTHPGKAGWLRGVLTNPNKSPSSSA